MDEESLDRFVRALYGENFDKQGLYSTFVITGRLYARPDSQLFGGREHTSSDVATGLRVW